MSAQAHQHVSRRGFLGTVGVAGACLAAVGSVGLSRPAMAEEVDIAALIKETLGAGEVAHEKVNLDVPAKAENGALVRLPIKVDHPQEAGNFIESVAIFVDKNPKPLVGVFKFTPEVGVVEFELRIKMAGPSKIRVVAKNNAGKLFGVGKDVDVAAGGCSG
ncbi:MAG: thiosulfate oxidation carrier protein SoxY [Magnetococcales bacterium]|nr:thiosulfate oxidation carrier protein SoxY [Magnetococcales bacterium]